MEAALIRLVLSDAQGNKWRRFFLVSLVIQAFGGG
jgi:hypothetical protein